MWGNIFGTLFYVWMMLILWVCWIRMERSTFKFVALIISLLVSAGVFFVLSDIWSSNA